MRVRGGDGRFVSAVLWTRHRLAGAKIDITFSVWKWIIGWRLRM